MFRCHPFVLLDCRSSFTRLRPFALLSDFVGLILFDGHLEKISPPVKPELDSGVDHRIEPVPAGTVRRRRINDPPYGTDEVSYKEPKKGPFVVCRLFIGQVKGIPDNLDLALPIYHIDGHHIKPRFHVRTVVGLHVGQSYLGQLALLSFGYGLFCVKE